MRFTTAQYLEKEVVTVSIQNDNASLAILDGMPVFFEGNNVTNVNLGVSVRTYSTIAGSSLAALQVGVAKTNKVGGLAVGDVGEAVCYGFTDAIVVRRTRTGTAASWPTAPAIGLGDQLVPETGNNYLTFSQTIAIGANPPIFAAGESFASKDTLTTGTANTAAGTADTAETVRMKVLVRAL